MSKQTSQRLSAGVFSFVVLLSGAAFAQDYKVVDVSESNTRAIVKGPAESALAGSTLVFTDKYSEDCRATVIKTSGASSTLDISECANRKSVKVGASFRKADAMADSASPSPSPTSKQPTGGAPTIDEDWYTLWGFGAASVDYKDDDTEELFETVDDFPGVDRSTYAFDLFGFYWPLDRQTMHGVIVNTVADSLSAEDDDDEDATFTLSQYLYAYSVHRFFGANIGDGPFVRGDIGLAKASVSLEDPNGPDADKSSKFGWGVLGGGGYSWGIGAETRMLLGAYYTYRTVKWDVETGKASALQVSLGFLF